MNFCKELKLRIYFFLINEDNEWKKLHLRIILRI